MNTRSEQRAFLTAYPGTCWRAGASRCEQKPFVDPRKSERGSMSLQMRLVHARKGLTPPALHTEEAARDMAAHAPQQDPMPASMRARFTATSAKGAASSSLATRQAAA